MSDITTQNIRQMEDAHASGVYTKRPLTIVRGEGAVLYDDAGNSYIDCVGGQGSANLGHCHPAVVAAIREQAGVLLSCTEVFYNDKRAQLLEKLTSLPEIPPPFLFNTRATPLPTAAQFPTFPP